MANQCIMSGTAATSAEVAAHIANVSNPHSVTKTQVSLSNVTNNAQLKESDLEQTISGTSTKIPSSATILPIHNSKNIFYSINF